MGDPEQSGMRADRPGVDDPEAVGLVAEAYVLTRPALPLYRDLLGELHRGHVPGFRHRRRPPDPATAAPWADPLVLESVAWLDLRGGPAEVQHPPFEGRHAGLQVVDLLARDVAHLGTGDGSPRAGREAGGGRRGGEGEVDREDGGTETLLVEGPTGPARPAAPHGRTDDTGQPHGRTDDTERPHVRAATPFARVVARTRVPPTGLGAAHAFQDAYAVRESPPPPAAPDPDLPGWDEATAAGPGFVTYARALAAGLAPGPERDTLLRVAQLAGTTPDPALAPAVRRGTALGEALLRDTDRREAGRPRTAPGTSGAVPRSEVAAVVLAGADGPVLHGTRRYRVVLAGAHLDGGRSGWSLTAYTSPSGALEPNVLDRYAVDETTPGLPRSSARAATVLVQHAAPRGSPDGVWLPAPSGPFTLVLRVYAPDDAVRDDEWLPPVVQDLGPDGAP